MKTVCDLAKRLIMAMDMGFSIQREDGHRWLNYDGGRDFCYSKLHEALKKNPKLFPECKTYGGYCEALNRLDKLTLELYGETLLQMYHLDQDDEEDEIWNEGIELRSISITVSAEE